MNIKTNVRERWRPGALAAAMLLALALALLPASALAQMADSRQPVSLVVAGPEDVPVGNLARIVAVLRDEAGKPIPGVEIVFSSPAAFAGSISEMDIDEVPTDKEGVATLDYQMRIQGSNQFIARFHGDATRRPAEAAALVLGTGQVQIAQRTAGVQVPVLGGWTLMAVLGAVWSVYFLALLMVAGIAESRRSRIGHEMGGKP